MTLAVSCGPSGEDLLAHAPRDMRSVVLKGERLAQLASTMVIDPAILWAESKRVERQDAGVSFTSAVHTQHSRQWRHHDTLPLT